MDQNVHQLNLNKIMCQKCPKLVIHIVVDIIKLQRGLVVIEKRSNPKLEENEEEIEKYMAIIENLNIDKQNTLLNNRDKIMELIFNNPKNIQMKNYLKSYVTIMN